MLSPCALLFLSLVRAAFTIDCHAHVFYCPLKQPYNSGVTIHLWCDITICQLLFLRSPSCP